MANLHADSNFFISDTDVREVTLDNVNSYDIRYFYTANNIHAGNFSVAVGEFITNVEAQGTVLSVFDTDPPTYPSGNAFSTLTLTPTATSNVGSGLTLNLQVDSTGDASLNVVSPGTGYYEDDTVTFSALDTHRDSDMIVSISGVDREGIDYFPTGLSSAYVVSNAVPLMNLEYGF